MTFTGMDVEAALAHARTLESGAAQELAGIITTLNSIIPQILTSWTGPDAAQFGEQWTHHQQILLNLQTNISDVVTAINKNAAEQAQASNS